MLVSERQLVHTCYGSPAYHIVFHCTAPDVSSLTMQIAKHRDPYQNSFDWKQIRTK